MAKSVGLLQPTPPFTTSSLIRCMLALTPMAKPDQNVTSMNTVLSKNGCANYLSVSGPFSIQQHHPGYIDWPAFEANQSRFDSNTRPQPHQSGGAVREGSALLQGIIVCGHCGRRLHVHYRGRNSTPGYHCSGKDLVNGRGVYCLTLGGLAIEKAVTDAFSKRLPQPLSMPCGSRSSNSMPTMTRH